MLQAVLQKKFFDSVKEKKQRLIALSLGVLVFGVLSFLGTTYFNQHYILGLNTTKSLPGTLFLINKDEKAIKGDLVGFSFFGHLDYYPKGTMFIKILAGSEGDLTHIQLSDKCFEYYVNNTSFGCIKERSSKGKVLELGSLGYIPKGRYAVRGLHEDSFDSRYGEVGLIKESATLGKAYRVF